MIDVLVNEIKICKIKSYLPVGSMLIMVLPEFVLSLRIVQYKLIYDGMAKFIPTYEYCLCDVISLSGPLVNDARTFFAGCSDGSRMSNELIELISSRQDVVIGGVLINV